MTFLIKRAVIISSQMQKREIYLDYAATTPVDPRVAKVVASLWSKRWGNPSSAHFSGQAAKVALDRARQTVADFLGAEAEEIIFTSGATESINLAHKGLIEGFKKERNEVHLITTKIEHKAVLESCRHLRQLGWAKIDYLNVSRSGQIDLDELSGLIRPETRLVSIGFVNNELGTIQPIAKIGKFLGELNKKRRKRGGKNIYFHSDITQAMGHLNIQVYQLGLDLASFSGHKIYAPKGVGGLWVSPEGQFVPQQNGGGQEEGRRSGTENLGGIVGLAEALTIIKKERKVEQKRLKKLKQRLVKKVLATRGVLLLGDQASQAAHIVPLWIEGKDGDSLIMDLSQKGIAASAGSACSTGRVKTSHVMEAIGLEVKKGGLVRFSLGRWTTEKEIDFAVAALREVL